MSERDIGVSERYLSLREISVSERDTCLREISEYLCGLTWASLRGSEVSAYER